MKTYIAVYIGSAFLALLITPIVIRIARRLNIVAVPGPRDVHKGIVPRIGGVAIFFAAVPLSVSVPFLSNAIGDTFRNILPELTVMLLAAAFMFTVGLLDDVRGTGLRARTKFLAQLLAAVAVCRVGIRIDSISIPGLLTFDFGWLSWPLSLLWIVGITNAVNLSDGLDGLAAGISAIACGVIAVFAINSSNVVMAILMLAMVGSLSGFLFYNFSPAKIFMGDCGSMFLGFTIASSSILCSSASSALVGLALPVLALGVPIFDTLFSMLRRFIERRSMFAADRRHFHHKLIDLGLTQRHVVVTIYIVTLVTVGLGMFMMVTQNIGSLAVFFCILLLLLLVFRCAGSVRFKEIIEGLQRKYAMNSQERKETKCFEDAQLYFRNARTRDQWWFAVCEAAQEMDFVWVSLKTRDQDGTAHTEVWRTTKAPPGQSNILTMTIPLRNYDGAGPIEFEIAVSINGSYESAGHRATLFGRLIDDHEVTNSGYAYKL